LPSVDCGVSARLRQPGTPDDSRGFGEGLWIVLDNSPISGFRNVEGDNQRSFVTMSMGRDLKLRLQGRAWL